MNGQYICEINLMIRLHQLIISSNHNDVFCPCYPQSNVTFLPFPITSLQPHRHTTQIEIHNIFKLLVSNKV